MSIHMLDDFDYGAAIIEIEQMTGISQAEIARSIGCTRGRVWQIKNGVNSENVKYELKHALYELCKSNGINVYDLNINEA